MGRSKFPGKPSKHINRTRVNVLAGLELTTNEIPSRDNSVEGINDFNKNEEKTEDETEILTGATDVHEKSVTPFERLNHKQPEEVQSKKQTRKKRLVTNSPARSNRIKSKVKLKNEARHRRNKVKSSRQLKGFSVRKHTSTNLVGKFVLPSKSVHSSRVIKPNKRFINVEYNSDLRTFTTKMISKRPQFKPVETVSKTENQEVTTSNSKGFKENKIETSKKESTVGKIVIRQARLQLHNRNTLQSQGPFSANSNNGNCSSTLTCGVCGAVRFYRFIKKAKIFNIFSCELCRKFIAKMIKCQKNKSIGTLVCQKGQGTCHIAPVIRSQQLKLIHCAYRSRCPACWLKLCLRSFQLPYSLKSSLLQLLPKSMQSENNFFATSLPLLPWPSNTSQRNFIQEGIFTNKQELFKYSCTSENTSVRQRPIRLKKKEVKTSNNHSTSDINRQKIDLKGPRVKHVCRSASIVLGQTPATFPSNDSKKENVKSENTCNISNIVNESDDLTEKLDETVEKENIIDNEKMKTKPTDTSLLKTVLQKVREPAAPLVKREKCPKAANLNLEVSYILLI